MKIYLANQLKALRQEKNVSQEKLAAYLNVSFQAVSKWENDISYPDIALLPEIARFFGITVDELLQVEKLDEEKQYAAYEKDAYALVLNGCGNAELLAFWLAAYQKMPNHIGVKEMLMSAYYDADKVKYKDEILHLGTEIVAGDASNYYKGQAIREMANTYAATGHTDLADQWAAKSFSLMHCQEVIRSQILDGEEMLKEISFFVYWVMEHLFYMANRCTADTIPRDEAHKQAVLETTAELYEVLFKNDDMGFEDVSHLYALHMEAARMEAANAKREETLRRHLQRALELAQRSVHIEEHTLTLPLLDGWHIYDATPADTGKRIREMQTDLQDGRFDCVRSADWFAALVKALAKAGNENGMCSVARG